MPRRQEKAKKQKDEQGPRPMLLRCAAIATAFALAAAALGMRLFTLQIEEQTTWKSRAANQQLANVPIEASRGVIYDSNMKPLAQSNVVWTVEAAPNVLAGSRKQEEGAENEAARIAARELAKILELDEDELFDSLKDPEKMYYKVKAKIEKPVADQVRELCKEQELSGIYLREDQKRYYPYEELAATVLGFTNADGDGIEGLESEYNEVLSGTAGRQVAVRNAWGGEIAADEEAVTYPAEEGENIVLTLDADIQQVAEKYLAAAVKEHNARQRGMCIVMDVNTGGILAMATSPAYNPNDPYYIYDEATREAIDGMPDGDEKTQAQSDARMLQWRNKALADTYEPGSVFKMVTAAAALDSGRCSIDSTFYCPSEIRVVEDEEVEPFHCALNQAHGTETLRQALIDSCNVSFIQIGQALGAHTWYDYLNAFGLTEPTGVDLPGEPGARSIANLVYAEDALGPVQLASCSFGQSNKYTALQMITAASAVVNGGNLVQPHIVKEIRDNEGALVKSIEPEVKRQVVSAEVSEQLCDAMWELVAATPNGRNAYVAGYDVGGKSGTSQKLERLNQDGEEVYISSFLGFAPANDPQIAVLVALDEPEDTLYGNYFGGRLAGPTAGNIIRDSLQILGVPPVYDTADDLARSTMSAPNVVDNELAQAEATLNGAGLAAVIVGTGGRVVAQSPGAYTQVPNGGLVVLYTDEGVTEETVEVPELIGQSAEMAMDTLKSMGLNVLTTGAPDGGESVLVVGQDREKGSKLSKGSVVTLTMRDVSQTSDH